MSKTIRPLILLDCDGPIADFTDGFLGLIEEETGYAFGHHVITEFEITKAPFFVELAKEVGRDPGELSAAVWKRANRIGFCSSLKPIFGSKDAIDYLRTIADVEVVTSPLMSSPTWMHERTEWLNRHYGFRSGDVHFVSKKHRVPGSMLVDDKASHLLEWEKAWSGVTEKSPTPVLWDAPYNQEESSLVRAKGWLAVKAVAQALVG